MLAGRRVDERFRRRGVLARVPRVVASLREVVHRGDDVIFKHVSRVLNLKDVVVRGATVRKREIRGATEILHRRLNLRCRPDLVIQLVEDFTRVARRERAAARRKENHRQPGTRPHLHFLVLHLTRRYADGDDSHLTLCVFRGGDELANHPDGFVAGRVFASLIREHLERFRRRHESPVRKPRVVVHLQLLDTTRLLRESRDELRARLDGEPRERAPHRGS